MKVSKFICGVVAIIGVPNAGKSTLVNALVGSAVAITSKMAGTTRDAIRGIINTDDSQIIFVDTPGMQETTNLLERKMNRAISGAVKSADLICFVIDVQNLTKEAIVKLGNYKDFGVPVIVALTKIDKVKPDKIFQSLDKLKHLDFIKSFVPISAYNKIGLDLLINEFKKYLPEGNPIYEKELYTDNTIKNMIEEIIRGEVINNVRDEVPRGVNVIIQDYNEIDRTIKISADIVCDKESHKKIIVGANGHLIKKIGIDARKKIESLLGKHIILNTFVIVREGWRDKENWIKS